MVKYLKKNSVIESINNNQSSAGPPNGHIKRIQSAYNQKAMATCTTEVFNSDIDILDTDGALSNG